MSTWLSFFINLHHYTGITCEDCIGIDWFNKSQAITDFNKLKNGDSDHIISILDEYDIDLNDVKYFF